MLTPGRVRAVPIPWWRAGAVAARTERLKLLVAFRPRLHPPPLLAQQAQYPPGDQRGAAPCSSGIVCAAAATPWSSAPTAYFLDHDGRYERTGEFITRCSGAPGRASRSTTRAPTTGCRGEGSPLAAALDTPDVYFGGGLPRRGAGGRRWGGRLPDWGEPPAMIVRKVARVRELAAEAGREPRSASGSTSSPATTSEEAWAHARRLLERHVPRQESCRRPGAVRPDGLRGAAPAWPDLHGGSADALEISPNPLGRGSGWSGRARAPRWSAGYAEVAERIREYSELGLSESPILSGWPQPEVGLAGRRLRPPPAGRSRAVVT
ncbi:LLM class flavin-dependent oxidoreductase [Streptosporangium vulgare]|uniref:LLM class flavin-dependent oxidoreductase n=1 Tax=Streptosporangium vulgare TaxID=46190 RepID=UPI0031D83E5B